MKTKEMLLMIDWLINKKWKFGPPKSPKEICDLEEIDLQLEMYQSAIRARTAEIALDNFRNWRKYGTCSVYVLKEFELNDPDESKQGWFVIDEVSNARSECERIARIQLQYE